MRVEIEIEGEVKFSNVHEEKDVVALARARHGDLVLINDAPYKLIANPLIESRLRDSHEQEATIQVVPTHIVRLVVS